ncbi:MAG: 5'/3'-nucleotidase SurE [Bacteroidales bacterium]|nr:5'/3'-nucleotidase SurE [Bacteroidales bacterium]
MKPLILITNDDGFAAKGLRTLDEVAMEFGDVIVMAPEHNSSGKSHSLTTERPLRVREIKHTPGLDVYACDGTPVDCIKLASEYFCPRKPDLVLSGINHGSNSSINVLYSGTMGAVIEATALEIDAIGFSLLNHNPDADFSACVPIARHIIGRVLEQGLPLNVSLNVNIPRLPYDQLRGIRICHEAKAKWLDSFEQRTDPQGRPYWWLTGKFVCNDPPETSDEWALAHGYVSVVPIHPDFTHYPALDQLQNLAFDKQ